MNLIRKWEGYYQYGSGYTLLQFGERVNIIVVFEGMNNSLYRIR